MDAKVVWKGRLSFDGTADSGFNIRLGGSPEVGGDNDGFRPVELLLVGLAGCTAMDVISILKKMRQQVTDFEVRVHGERASDHPRKFTHIVIEYAIAGHNVDPAAVHKAVDLSATRYCSVQASLDPSIPVEHRITIREAEPATA
ncbi:MAG: OsmC family protein [Anaerolineae bacterium]|nr:OsmC family protein [Thermoflexales bacterium]MDW8407623.1 OsmC family protein [Anaerolineae bacterium]